VFTFSGFILDAERSGGDVFVLLCSGNTFSRTVEFHRSYNPPEDGGDWTTGMMLNLRNRSRFRLFFEMTQNRESRNFSWRFRLPETLAHRRIG